MATELPPKQSVVYGMRNPWGPRRNPPANGTQGTELAPCNSGVRGTPSGPTESNPRGQLSTNGGAQEAELDPDESTSAHGQRSIYGFVGAFVRIGQLERGERQRHENLRGRP